MNTFLSVMQWEELQVQYFIVMVMMNLNHLQVISGWEQDITPVVKSM